MTLATWPAALAPERMHINLVPTSGGSEASPYSGKQTFFRLPRAYWRAGMSWSSAREWQWRRIHGFVAGLAGRAGRFLLVDPSYSGPLGGAGRGTVTATGTAMAANVTLDGIVGHNPVLMMGDRLSIADRLYQVTDDVYQTGGQAVVPIAPLLRASCSNAAAELMQPVGTFRLASDDQGSASIRPPWFAELSVDFVEPP